MKYLLIGYDGRNTFTKLFFFKFAAKRVAKQLIEEHNFKVVEIKKGRGVIIRAELSIKDRRILWL